MGIVAGIVRDAVARNELAIAESLTPEENTKEFMKAHPAFRGGPQNRI